MFRLPWTDATLRLAPPLAGWSVIPRFLLLAISLLLVLTLLARLYRYELKLIPRRFARILLALRVVLIACVVLLVAVEPVVCRVRTEEVPGRVMIAIDRSDSMTVADPARPTVEKLRLAKILKLVPDIAGDSQLDSWASDSDDTPKFGSGGERERFEQVIRRVDALPRLELCARLLTPDGLNLLAKLREKHGVELLGFGRDVSALPVDPAKLTAALTGRSGDAVASTDLKLPLIRAAASVGDEADAGGAKLLGVILLTDGRHNWGESPLARAEELGRRQVPIFPISIAPKDPPADVAVVSARPAAATVFKGSTVPVEVSVRVTGWPAGKIPVRLDRPPAADGTPREPLCDVIDHTGPDATYPLTFKPTMDEPGPQSLTVIVEPGDADRFPANNRRTARVNVVKDRAKVLLIDGDARWEFHYLHTCLGRDPNMDVRSVVFRQPRLDLVSEEELKKVGTPAKTLPADLDLLSAYDCIILGDVEEHQLSPAQRKGLEKYVAEAGGTLVISAGKRAMPMLYSTLEDDPLRKLLPIKNVKVVATDEGVRPAFTPAGERSWFLAMADTAGTSKAAWEKFPPHQWAAVGELKDAAEALAVLPGQPGQALIARQHFGFGRVLYVGLDSTWRWRFRTGDYFHHRFWGQVAQWAASDRLLPVTNAGGTIRFGTTEPVYYGEQDIDIIVRAAEAVTMPGGATTKAARIVRLPSSPKGKETQVALVPLTTPDGRPRDLLGKARALTPGRYAVELDIPDWTRDLVGPPGPDGRAMKLRCPFEVVPADNDELIDLSANLPLLSDLAKVGGGRVVTPETATKLIDLLASRSATREQTVEHPVRQSWWTFALLVGLLATEWVVRKWAGLP